MLKDAVTDDPFLNAMVATAFISGVPFLFLVCISKCRGRAGIGDKTLKVLVSFAVGGLLGDAFLHLIPHALHPHHTHAPQVVTPTFSSSSFFASAETIQDTCKLPGDDGSCLDDVAPEMNVGLFVLLGMLLFFLVSKAAHIRQGGHGGHGHSHGAHSHGASSPKKTTKKSTKKAAKDSDSDCEDHDSERAPIKITGLLNLLADTTHNFTDGMAIAASFLAGPKVGLSTTLAVFIHEIPHEIGDYAILIQSGYTQTQAMKFQLVTALGAFLGCFFGFLTGGQAQGADWVLPVNIVYGRYDLFKMSTTVLVDSQNNLVKVSTIIKGFHDCNQGCHGCNHGFHGCNQGFDDCNHGLDGCKHDYDDCNHGFFMIATMVVMVATMFVMVATMVFMVATILFMVATMVFMVATMVVMVATMVIMVATKRFWLQPWFRLL
eukprot:g20610.t1